MAAENLILDDLELNDGAPWTILNGTFVFTPAKKKLNWATSALGDGSALIGDEDHYENAEMTFRVRCAPQLSTTAALSELDLLTAKLQLARVARGGMPLTWTPSGSGEAMTFYVLDGEYEEIPMEYEAGWTTAQPQLVVHLYLRPFGYGSEQLVPLGLSDSFNSDSITNGSWTYTTGSGLSIASGQISAPAGHVRIVRSPLISDQSITMRFKTGTSLSATPIGVLARGLTGIESLGVTVGNDLMRIRKTVVTTDTTLSSVSTSGLLATSTFYWLQTSFVGDDISAALYADAQNPLTVTTPTPIVTDTHTLTGGDATKFGEGIEGKPGIFFNATDSAWRVQHWTLSDASSMQTPEPLFSFELGRIDGHVPAEGRMVISEESSKTRAHFEWGLEQKNYDPNNTWPLRIDSDSMITSGFAGTQTTTYSGAYDPNASGGSQVMADDMSETVTLAVCSTGSQFHVGSFKVKARLRGDAGVMVRLSWRVGDGVAAKNNFTAPLTGLDWEECDLGSIVIPQAPLGEQAWTGRIEAYGVSGGQVAIDYLLLIPTDRYGVARAPLRPITPSIYSAFDNFNQASGNLSAKVAGSGGSWTTGNLNASTADFTVDNVTNTVQRSAMAQASVMNGRYGYVGTSNFAGIQVQTDVGSLTTPNGNLHAMWRGGILLRYVDTNNFLIAVRQTNTTILQTGATYNTITHLRLFKSVAGVVTSLGLYNEGVEPDITRTLICQVDALGIWQVFSFWPGQKQPAEAQLQGQDADLATGGALQNGKIGLYDGCSASAALTFVRSYDNFVAFASGSDAVLYSGQQLEVRADRTERSSTTGTTYGRVPLYRGSRLFIPQSGDDERVSRMAVKARRFDVDGGLPDQWADPISNVPDSIGLQVYATSRYLVPGETGVA